MPRFRKTTAVLLLAALFPLAAAMVIGMFGDRHWFAELFSHYQQQYALGLAAVTLAALVRKHFRLALVSGLVLLPPLGAVSYYYLPRRPPAADGGPALRLLSFNVLRSNHRRADVLAWLRKQDADVLLLLEINEEWSKALAPLHGDYPHRTGRLRDDAFGIVIFSKFPIGQQRITIDEAGRVPSIQADIEWPAATFRLFAVHPVPPVSRHAAGSRNKYLRAVAPRIARREDAAVAMGDFNCSPWSPHFRRFVAATGLIDSGRGRGFPSTWHRWNPFFSLPIDHILHSPHFTCTARDIGPALGSDHRAVTATLEFDE